MGVKDDIYLELCGGEVLRAEKKRGTSDKGNGNGARAKEDKPLAIGAEPGHASE